MQLTSRQANCSICSRPQRTALRIVVSATNNGYVPPSPSSLDRPSGGSSRTADVPRSSDISYSNWGPSSDILRPSGGANRLVVFASASADRPGGRGGRSDMPSGWDAPTPQDPALGRPGGRGGRDLGIESSNPGSDLPQDPALGRPGGRGGRDLGLEGSNPGSDLPQDPAIGRPGGRGGRDLGIEGGNQGSDTPQDPALSRPGGRGGRDVELSSSGPTGPVTPVSLDRPGGRGGRDSLGDGGDSGSGGGDNSGGDGNSNGGDGNSGGEGNSSDDSGFSLGKGVGGILLYAGAIAAAWAGHKAFFAKPAPAAEVVEPCCAGKGKGKK